MLMGRPAEKWLVERQRQMGTGVSRFVTGDFAVQRRFSAASTLQEQTLRAERQ
jgi:hypothetical protein